MSGGARRRSVTKENGSSRRAEILAVAAEVFAEKGILNATVRDIGDRAGILSGSLYHHFESKEQMVEEILMATGEPMLERSREVIRSASDAAEALRGCIVAAVDYVAGAPHEAAIQRNDARVIASIPRLAFVHQRRETVRKMWVDVVKRGQRDGTFRKDADPLLTVSAMWDAILASTRWLPPSGTSSPKRVAAQLADLFLSGVVAP